MLDDLHTITEATRILLIVRHELGVSPDVLLVLRILDEARRLGYYRPGRVRDDRSVQRCLFDVRRSDAGTAAGIQE